MKKHVVKISIIITGIACLVYLYGGLNNPLRFLSSTAQAVGDLSVDWGVPNGQPIFTVFNVAPGQSETRTVTVTNDSPMLRPVGVRGELASDSGNLSTAMNIVIDQNGTPLYGIGSPTGPKTLSEFFTESTNPDGIFLLNLNPATNKSLSFKVTFNESAGNEFQNKSLVFDLHIGISIDVPSACEGIKFAGQPIFGTAGNNKIKGTNKNDLIFALEGNDEIDGSNGDDCIIAGSGNDKITSSNGKDYMFGNEDDDEINGSNGVDYISGGTGNDKIDASNGNDIVFGDEGNDTIDGSNGKDDIEGGSGNDTIKGSNDNDRLIGGIGIDKVEGGNGKDLCDAETKSSCEQ